MPLPLYYLFGDPEHDLPFGGVMVFVLAVVIHLECILRLF